VLSMPPMVAVGPGSSCETKAGELITVNVTFRTYGKEKWDSFLFQGLVDFHPPDAWLANKV
jgi:hypothetical protein